jgi:hypothetical protein
MDGENYPKTRELREARERVVARLTEAFANDELAIAAFEQRIADAYQRTSVESLDALVADLEPAKTVSAELVVAPKPIVAQVVASPEARPMVASAILGSVERTGTMTLPADARASAVLGSLVIDLRGATWRGVAELKVRAVLGSIEIIVPADIAVECEGTGILGSFEGSSRVPAAIDPDAPRLRIVGAAVLGSIEVHVRPPTYVEDHAAQLRAKHTPLLR